MHGLGNIYYSICLVVFFGERAGGRVHVKAEGSIRRVANIQHGIAVLVIIGYSMHSFRTLYLTESREEVCTVGISSPAME